MQSQPRPTPTSRVTRDAVARAVDALLKWLLRPSSKSHRQDDDDDDDDDSLQLVLTLKKIPHRGRPAAFRVPLPRPLHSSACLLVDDGPNSALAPAAARATLARDLALPVFDVLPLSELRSLCRSPEALHSLAGSHDLFLADRRLAPLLPSLLGNPFFDKKKKKKKKSSNRTPVPLDLALPSWPEELRQVCASTVFHLGPGTCSVTKVGRASRGRDEVIDNVMAAIEGVVGHVPRKWKNVRSLHLKATNSLALPLYQAVLESGLKSEGSLKREDEGMVEVSNEEEDESDGRNRMEEEDVLTKKKKISEKSKNKDMKEIKRRKIKHDY